MLTTVLRTASMARDDGRLSKKRGDLQRDLGERRASENRHKTPLGCFLELGGGVHALR